MNTLSMNARSQAETRTNAPSALDTDIASATVLDLDAQVVSLGQLLSGQRSLLVFVRHYG